MRRFERQADGTVIAELDAEEALLLQSLASQIADVVASGASVRAFGGSGAAQHQGAQPIDVEPAAEIPTDPALARLLPDAYPQDAEASAEFRRFTTDTLIGRKLRNAETLTRSLDAADETGNVTLDDTQAQAWLRSLTDIRLTIAARLGIETEDDEAGRSIDPMMRNIYDWLGFVQNSLVEAMDDTHE